MQLHDEIYFEITIEGRRANVEKFKDFLLSGEFDNFFEISSDYIIYSDNYNNASENEEVSLILANDDIGIEIDRLNPEDFIDVLCSGGRNVFIHGNIFDIDDEEYSFVSHIGDTSFTNTEDLEFFDELDEEAAKEEYSADDDYE